MPLDEGSIMLPVQPSCGMLPLIFDQFLFGHYRPRTIATPSHPGGFGSSLMWN